MNGKMFGKMNSKMNAPFAFLIFVALGVLIGCGKSQSVSNSPATPHGDGSGGSGSPTSQTFDYTLTFPVTGLSAGMKFLRTPKSKINSPFTVRFWKTQQGNAQTGPFIDPGYPLVSAELQKPTEQDSIFLWMDSMGHGSDPVVVTRVVDSSGVSFPVDHVIFKMVGPWEIKIQLHQYNVDPQTGKKLIVVVNDPQSGKPEAAVVDAAQFNHVQKQ